MASTQAKTEQDPLLEDFCNHVSRGYSTESHAKFTPGIYGVEEVVADYEPLKLSTFRVFFTRTGTVLSDPIIFCEQLCITAVFAACALPVYIHFNKDAAMGNGDESMRKWLGEQEGRMREFAMIMTVLASLLLSFYSAMAVTRWWVIRTQGVGGIKAAAMELELLISQCVTQETQVLDSIRRYARASLMLVFMWRRKRLGNLKQDLLSQKLLTEQEADQMLKWNHCLHETIWAWQTAIVCTLWQEGKIKTEPTFRALLEQCSEGRKAIQVIHTYVAVRIPMQYVHLLGLLVKSHNLVLAVIMGSLFGAGVRNGETIICVQLAGRTCVLPLLFNAILLINAELSDPFSGSPTDFPGCNYQNALEKDGAAFVKAGQNMPEWLARRSQLPI
jgi:hypothetical protein